MCGTRGRALSQGKPLSECSLEKQQMGITALGAVVPRGTRRAQRPSCEHLLAFASGAALWADTSRGVAANSGYWTHALLFPAPPGFSPVCPPAPLAPPLQGDSLE